jgi:hypothetical protein
MNRRLEIKSLDVENWIQKNRRYAERRRIDMSEPLRKLKYPSRRKVFRPGFLGRIPGPFDPVNFGLDFCVSHAQKRRGKYCKRQVMIEVEEIGCFPKRHFLPFRWKPKYRTGEEMTFSLNGVPYASVTVSEIEAPSLAVGDGYSLIPFSYAWKVYWLPETFRHLGYPIGSKRVKAKQ